jgi:hypothetical protein
VRVELDGDQSIHLELVVVALAIELLTEVVNEVWVGLGLDVCCLEVLPERRQDFLGAVHEVEDVGRVLAGVRTVEARQRLHGLDAGEPAIDIHAAQQRLIEPGLELVLAEA